MEWVGDHRAVLGNHAESVLSVAEVEIIPQIQLVVQEVKEKEKLVTPMGGIRAVELKDETKDPVNQKKNFLREIQHVVEMQTRGKIRAEEAKSSLYAMVLET